LVKLCTPVGDPPIALPAPGAEAAETLFPHVASVLNKYASLNLLPVHKFGTIEMRRFGSTLDGEIATRWAYLCVGFVEAFKGGPAAEPQAAMLDGDAVGGLLALQVAQERATADELVRLLAPHVDEETCRILMADAVGNER